MDKKKETANIAKHGVDFSEAQTAFSDPAVSHGSGRRPRKTEPRCSASVVAEAAAFLPCVSLIAATAFESLVREYWEEGRKSMKKEPLSTQRTRVRS